MIRVFVSHDLHQSATVTADEATHHYLFHVMRRNVKDCCLLFNGRDGEWLAEIVHIDKRRTDLTIVRQTRLQQHTRGATLAMALIKKDHFDLVLHKATELGARKIIPVLASRSVVRQLNADRTAVIVKEAAEQSERLDVPEVTAPVTVAALLNQAPAGQKIVYLNERGKTAGAITPADDVCFVIGPEGGWTAEELALFEGRGCVSLNLGELILRAETAAIGVLAAHRFDIFDAFK